MNAAPGPLAPNLSMTVLRRQMDGLKLAAHNVHNLARSMFQPGVEVKYRLSAREYYGRVVEVIGEPGSTKVRVVNVATNKRRDIDLADIVGFIQEA